MGTKIEITYGSYIRFFVVLLGLAFLYYTRDILVLLFLVLIIVAGLSPTVEKWSKYLTRPGAVITVFVIILAIIGLTFSLLIPPLVGQINQFSNNLPEYVARFSNPESGSVIDKTVALLADNLNTLSSRLTDFSGFILDQTLGILGGLVAAVAVIVLSFYLLLEEEGLKKIYQGIIPAENREGISEITRKISGKLGLWLRGQLILMFIVGATATIGLAIVGAPFPLTLGLWAGLTEIVPWIGPWIGAVPGVAVGFVQSPLTGFLTIIVYLFIHQLEGNFLVPKLMGKVIGLNPVVVLLAILFGGKLYGVFGILLSIPIAAVIGVIVEDWPTIRETFQGLNRKRQT